MTTSQNDIYQTYTNNELAVVLSHFNQDYVYNVMKRSMNDRSLLYATVVPNLVMGFESQFKDVLANYPLENQTINSIRMETYERIIKMLCDKYGIVFNDGGQTDIYSSAIYMYGFLISQFRANIVNFFSLYIYQERNSLFDILSSYDRKTITTSYNKKLYKNNKMGLISANVDLIITNICTFDIPMHKYIEMSLKDYPLIAQHLNNIISPTDDFFKVNIASIFNTEARQNVITDIRIALQNMIPDAELNTADYIRQIPEGN